MRTLEEIQSDKGFGEWIEREWPDPKIANLVYNCYLAGIETFWSNEGRIGQKLPGYKMHKAPEGFYVFDEGYLAYRVQNETTRRFHDIVLKVIEKNPQFVKLNPAPTTEKPETWLFLGFDDIKEKGIDVWEPHREIEVVRQDLAEKRLAQIDILWQYLTNEAEKLV
ncbi:hypothetical protein KA107_01385 [Candidatus Pacearchaeota archaeon]|nr:hypothetical protein [Candidatus Pacearchaeota archaeon]